MTSVSSTYLIQVIDSLRIRLRGEGRQQELDALINELNRRWDGDVPFMDQAYVAFDLETTGLHPFGGDRITALGAVRIEKGEVTSDGFEQLVNPGRTIPHDTAALTGITDPDVAGAPSVQAALPWFLAFLAQGVPLGYNADFDLAFLNLALRPHTRLKISRAAVLDILPVVQALNPRWEHPLLDDVANHYGVPLERRHSALGDAVIHARLFLSLIPLLRERGIYTLKDLRSYLHYKGFF
ncbi:MAG: exonuclease domain-containing protein [Thermoanaerobacterales bacterium]|nr:exonuclease domain-containing protein [Thermoanaerobacterales bacterium]